MARERMVTRTIVSTDYVVMVVNMETKQVENVDVSIPSADSLTEKKKEQLIKAALPEGKMFVSIIGQALKETLYGMPESEFIKLAKVLPPRA